MARRLCATACTITTVVVAAFFCVIPPTGVHLPSPEGGMFGLELGAVEDEADLAVLMQTPVLLQAKQRMQADVQGDKTEQVPGACEDKWPPAECEREKQRHWNCMNMPTPYVPGNYEANHTLMVNCAKTCAYCGNEYAMQEFYARKIRADNVENELSYPKEGDPGVPPTMHGIWWMDQRHVHTEEGTKCDPSYKDLPRIPTPFDEVLATWGDGMLMDPPGAPQKNCMQGTPYGGRQGHWSYLDSTGTGHSDNWFMNYGMRFGGFFCFEGDNKVKIFSRFIPYIPLVAPFLTALFGRPIAGFYQLPDSVASWTMEKTCFGWDRISNLGPKWVRAALFGKLATTHYPVFQVVDGKGQRVPGNYEAYLKYVSTDLGCTVSNATCWLNKDPGHLLVPTWTGKPIGETHPLSFQVSYLKLSSVISGIGETILR